MIIREKKLRRIVSEAMGHRDVDIMVLKAYSRAKEKGYMVKDHLNSMLTIGSLGDVELYHLPDLRHGARYKRGKYCNVDLDKLLASRASIEEGLDHFSSNTTTDDLARAISMLSSFLEGAYTMVRLSRYLKPGRNIYFETCAWDLIQCYEHMARAYLRMLPAEEKKEQK